MTASETGSLVKMASAPFPAMESKNLGDVTASWQMTIGDLPFDLARRALLVVLNRKAFFPAPSEIRTAAVELSGGFGLPTLAEAFLQLRVAVKRKRYNECHVAVEYVIRSIGLEKFIHTEDPEVMYSHFRAAYAEQAHKLRKISLMPVDMQAQALTGYPIELQQAMIGTERPALTGGED
ncbi:MAG: hypothetical protein PHT33_10775 [bacterium]|nr:hypothetical protein [bacterium]